MRRIEELGVSQYGLSTQNDTFNEPEAQRRVLEAERSIRDARLWIIAVISALASLASAIAAWVSAAKSP